MVIYELGIIKAGVPLVSKLYYKEHSIPVDPVLRSGFLSALNSFASQAFADEIESFTMKNFRIVLLSREIIIDKPTNLISYCIGDKKLNLKLAKKALNRVLDEFLALYDIKNLPANLNEYNKFLQILDDIIGDFAKKPEDRLKSIFG